MHVLVLERRNMSYWYCAKCNDIFLPYENHCCKPAEFLSNGIGDTNSGFQISSLEINNVQLPSSSSHEIVNPRESCAEISIIVNKSSELAQETIESPNEATLNIEFGNMKIATTDAELPSLESSSLSDEVYYQSAIYNTGSSNISNNLDIKMSESQEGAELNRDFANMKVVNNARLPPFRSTCFSSGYGNSNYGIPNPSQRLTSICESASVADVPNEACTAIQQMSGYSYTTDRLSDVHINNMLNDCCTTTNKEQTSENTVSFCQSAIGSKASENSGFSISKEQNYTHASDSHQMAVCSNSKKKTHDCPVCHKEFPSQSTLKTHSSVHSDEKPFICDVCGRSFRLKHQLKHHKIHLGHNPSSDASGSRQNSCSVCGKVYPCKSYLERHKKKHTSKRQFVCDICNKSFKSKASLKVHSVLHSKPKLLECDICKKAFSHRSSLKSHYIVHTDKKWFQCDMCEKVYSDKSTLRKHRLNHKGKKEL